MIPEVYTNRPNHPATKDTGNPLARGQSITFDCLGAQEFMAAKAAFVTRTTARAKRLPVETRVGSALSLRGRQIEANNDLAQADGTEDINVLRAKAADAFMAERDHWQTLAPYERDFVRSVRAELGSLSKTYHKGLEADKVTAEVLIGLGLALTDVRTTALLSPSR